MRRARLDLEDDKVRGTGTSHGSELDLRLDDKRVERILRAEGEGAGASPQRGRSGSMTVVHPAAAGAGHHVWAYDSWRTAPGSRKLRMLTWWTSTRGVPAYSGGPPAQGGGRDQRAGGSVHPARHPRPHPVGQWAELWPKPCRLGSLASAPRRRLSSPAAREKTAMWRASTASCATSF
jgi:hypothetical protein